ncbi:alpha/beta fold hydrolase [Gordonia rhizosphera NBRC 16068]|uniref:alpha/beta fold hydrolase n=1 Tax=Gordonia rhizosphera TaxID=83341 RepID=UPI000320080C
MLFSHSWFCDGHQWPQVDAVVNAGFRVLNLDNRGHGHSGPHRRRYAVWDMADDLVAVLDDAHVDQAVLVGLSVGGFAAIRAALRHPGRVRALVLADTAASAQGWPGKLKADALGPVWLTPARKVVLPQLVKTLFGPTARGQQPRLIDEWRQRFLTQDARSMMAALRAIVTRDDVTDRLHEITVPTQVIVGEEDHDPGVMASISLSARIPGAHLIALPDTGHLSALEQPAAFGDPLLDFLRAHDGHTL